jgi:uncharacterized protein
MPNEQPTYTAFAGFERIATGPLAETVRRAKAHLDRHQAAPVLVFEDETGTQLDFDWRGTTDDVVARLAHHPYLAMHLAMLEQPAPQRTGPGRPKLGVVSREVSLLPRHWEWLGEQPGGASAALRRLVDQARKSTTHEEHARRTRDATSRFMTALAGDLPGFEEASRALYSGDRARFMRSIARWPKDLHRHLAERWPVADPPA